MTGCPNVVSRQFDYKLNINISHIFVINIVTLLVICPSWYWRGNLTSVSFSRYSDKLEGLCHLCSWGIAAFMWNNLHSCELKMLFWPSDDTSASFLFSVFLPISAPLVSSKIQIVHKLCLQCKAMHWELKMYIWKTIYNLKWNLFLFLQVVASLIPHKGIKPALFWQVSIFYIYVFIYVFSCQLTICAVVFASDILCRIQPC